jgi:hypothetical protein
MGIGYYQVYKAIMSIKVGIAEGSKLFMGIDVHFGP